jgi:hypothetical protein
MAKRDNILVSNGEWLKEFMERTGRGIKGEVQPVPPQAITPQAAIIRQATKDRRNKLEKQFEAEQLYWRRLRGELDRYTHNAPTLPLANGVTYKPDYYASKDGKVLIYEVKGEKRNGKVVARDDAVVKIKVAAKEWPEFDFFLTWKDADGWKYQEVKEVE